MKKINNNKKLNEIKRNRSLYLMLLPAVIMMLVFVYYPFVRGIKTAFMDFSYFSDSTYVGLENIKKVLADEDFYTALYNTVIFGVVNVVLGVVFPATMAILLNEVRLSGVKRFFQTVLYLPSLFSWVIVGSMFVMLLSPTIGPINSLIEKLGGDAIYFFAEPKLAKILFILLGQWKSVGFGLVVYLAVITNIDMCLYEAADVDGCSRWQKIRYITIPELTGTIKMMLMFGVIGIFSLFDQVYVLDNGLIHDEVDVIMTYIYSTGIRQMRLSYASAAGLIVGTITLITTLISKKALGFSFDESEDGE